MPRERTGPTAERLLARVRRAKPVVPLLSRRVQVTHAVPSADAVSVIERTLPATDVAGPGSGAPRWAEATTSARRVSGPCPHASSAPPPGEAWISGPTPSRPSERAVPKDPCGARRA